jgi:hypothetical protein
MNAVIQAIADLWTNQQALAAQVAAVGGLALRQLTRNCGYVGSRAKSQG